MDRCKTQIMLAPRFCNSASIRIPTELLRLHGTDFAWTVASPRWYLPFACVSQILYTIHDTIHSYPFGLMSPRDVKSVSEVLTWAAVICLQMKLILCSSGLLLSELSFSARGPMLAPLSPQGRIMWSDLPAETSLCPRSPGAGVCSAVGYAAITNANCDNK